MSGPPSASVAVIGAGSIGFAWAIVFARAGHQVHLYDADSQRVELAMTETTSRLIDLAAAGLLTEDPEVVLARIRPELELAVAVADVSYVQECVIESLSVKTTLFTQLDRLAPASAVLASSTSAIPASQFAAELAGRARCLVVHPGNPPYLLPIAEVVPAPFTSSEAVCTTASLLTEAGMTPVVLGREIEGFVFNRLQGALLREAYCLVRDGVIGARDLDLVVTRGLGRRWAVLGPFATAELNTRGGIERHAQLLGPAYARMGASRGQDDPWTTELVSQVAKDIHEVLRDDSWADNVNRRDRALMKLDAARADAPDLFTGFA